MTSRAGVALALAAYLMWGLFPLYFALLGFAGPVEVVLHRVLWALLLCAVLLGMARGWRAVRALEHRQVAGLALAAVVLSLNWGFFVYGVTSGQVVETSLGYFINPLVSVCLGVLVLRERLGAAQWAAVAVAATGVAVLTLDYGRPPWLALTLASSFGVYGLVKKRIGRGVGALPGLTVETAALAPFALAGLVVLGALGQATVTPGEPEAAARLALLAGSGLLTAVPLLLFAAAARRVRLSTIGMLQYVTPVMHLFLGVTVFGEPMPPLRLVGFTLVWLALALLGADGLRRAARPGTGTGTGAGAGAGSRKDAGPGTGADTDTGPGTDTRTGADTDTGPGTDTRTGADAGVGSGAGPNAGRRTSAPIASTGPGAVHM